ncbi:DUF4226 domain-containing protein (plasmid) [Mycolicibacterium aichiense]|uniref:DUF4226 domain-containing protein n=1 Tax=Mycolicibacterium aichiense TaxID=1799 RepID=UPI003D676C68
MSLTQTCAEVEAAIARARSLFGVGATVDVPDTAQHLTQAAQSVTAVRARTTGQTGSGIASYQAMADASVPPLAAAAGSDTALAGHASSAGAITQAGAARMDQIAAATRSTTAAAPVARNASAQRVVLAALRSQVSQASQVVASTQQQAAVLAGQVHGLEYPKDAPVQALDHQLPQSPAPGADPPHGTDPRYWIDVGKIIYVPDGKLAPANTVQIGSNMYYPAPYIPDAVSPPPAAAQHPLNPSDVRVVGPNQLLPPGYRLVAPGIGLPDPDAGFQPQSPWVPKSPVDVRDVIHLVPGQLAPWGYREYLPGWWAPDPAAYAPG